MSIPVIPNHPSSELKMSNCADSCNLNQTTNISLAGLSSGGGSMSFNSNANVSLTSGGSITISEGYLQNWLVAVNLDPSYDTLQTGHRMSEFPVGRSCQTAGYLAR
jgi:hypothetical protein